MTCTFASGKGKKKNLGHSRSQLSKMTLYVSAKPILNIVMHFQEEHTRMDFLHCTPWQVAL